MKIAQICSSINVIPPIKTGGTEQPIYYLAKGLAERGHQITIYAAEGSSVPGVKTKIISPFAPCVKQEFLNIQERIATFYDLSALMDFFKNEADYYDIIQFNGYLFYEILPFSKMTKKPILIRINYPHDLIFPYIKKQVQTYKNIFYLPISNFIKQSMPELPYLEPIYPAVDMNEFKFSAKSKSYLLFMGRICHNKGAHIAIDVAKKTKTRLIIAGKISQENAQEYFRHFIEPYIDNKNIIYLGEVDFKTKVRLYRNAFCTLFPILWDEPFGNVQIESMACGTPVITFDRAAAREVIKDGFSGYISKDGSSYQMARAVEKVKRLSRANVRAWAEKNFSLSDSLDKYERVYKQISKLFLR